MTAVVRLVLSSEGVTSRVEAQSKHFLTATGTTQRALHKVLAHFPSFELLLVGGRDGAATACKRFLIGVRRTMRSMVDADTLNVAAISVLVS